MSESKWIGRLTSGHARCVQPIAVTAISTSASGLTAGPVEIPVDGAAIPAYRARPTAPGPHPVVLVVHEIFGAHEYIQDVCRRLAHEGFLAIAPVLGLYGEQDAAIPLESIALMRHALEAAGDASEFVIYPDAPHGFHSDYRESFRKDAAEDGFRRMLAWFAALAGSA